MGCYRHGIFFLVIISGAKYFIDNITVIGHENQSSLALSSLPIGKIRLVVCNQQCCYEHLNLWCILFRRVCRKQGKQIYLFSELTYRQCVLRRLARLLCQLWNDTIDSHATLFNDFVSFST
jgi:hypothetical protein